MIDQPTLISQLNYDSSTGLFTWKVTRGKSRKNKYAGGIKGVGYIGIRIYGISYYAHRLAWLYIYGYITNIEIDHINGIKTDNRICNLREVTRSENEINKTPSCRNKSGCRGVQWHPIANKWHSRIMKDGKDYYLGLFNDLNDAIHAYKNKRDELYNIGGFANEI